MFLIWTLLAVTHAQELLSNPRCNLVVDRGSCMQFSIQWYYDRYAHRCRRFHYGGCEGNENRFSTLEECNSACAFRPPSNQERCFQPHDPGHCESDIERWYFDKDKRQCVCSWWSGCGGNSNLFFSYKHCMLICGEFATTPEPGVDEKYVTKRNRSLVLIGDTGMTSHQRITQWGQHPQAQSPHWGQHPQPSQWDQQRPHQQSSQWSQPHQSQHGSQSSYNRQWEQHQAHQQSMNEDQSRPAADRVRYVEHGHSYQRERERQRESGHSYNRYPETSAERDQTRRLQDSRGYSHNYGRGEHQEQQQHQHQHQQQYPYQYQQQHQQQQHPHKHQQQQQQQHQQQALTSREYYDHGSRRQNQENIEGYSSPSHTSRQSVPYNTGPPGSKGHHVGEEQWHTAGTPSSGYSEFRSSNAFSSSSNYHQSSSNSAHHSSTSWRSSTPSRTHGERIYRYDTGPIRKVHPNGTVTVNRKVVYYTANNEHATTFMQQIPDFFNFARAAPAAPVPPYTTAIPPALRQRLKQIMKKKVPPRKINPVSQHQAANSNEWSKQEQGYRQRNTLDYSLSSTSSPYDDNRRYDMHIEREEQRPSMSPRQQPAEPDNAASYAAGKPRNEALHNVDSSGFLLAQMTTASPPSNSSPPTLQSHVASDNSIRSDAAEISPQRVDFDDVIEIDSQAEDDYVYPKEDLNDLETFSAEVRNEIQNRRQPPKPRIPTVSPLLPTLKPIVLPPAGYLFKNANVGYESRDGLRATMRDHYLDTPSTTSPSVATEASTTEMTITDDYSEDVEFEIQPVGVQL